MRSKVALLLLLVVAGFVVATIWERCDEGDADCPALCHAGCLDGCATAPVPCLTEPMTVPRIVRAAPPVPSSRPLARTKAPDIQPPRA